MRGEVLDVVERRRRRSDEEKLRILMEVGFRGATLTDVARRHSVSRSQLYAWRRELKRHGALRPPEAVEGRPVFVPVAPPLLPAPVSEPLPSGDAAPTTPVAGCGNADGPLLIVAHFTNIAELTEFDVYEGEIMVLAPKLDRRVLGYMRLRSASPDVGHFGDE